LKSQSLPPKFHFKIQSKSARIKTKVEMKCSENHMNMEVPWNNLSQGTINVLEEQRQSQKKY
jgi:hypothetical protein